MVTAKTGFQADVLGERGGLRSYLRYSKESYQLNGASGCPVSS